MKSVCAHNDNIKFYIFNDDQETLKLELDQAKEEVQSTKKGFFARLFGG